MEKPNTEENSKQELELTCPFFQVRCVSFCPAWLDAMEDCLFHVCLTDVRETFFEGAEYLDRQIGLVDGTGAVLMQGAREGIAAGSSSVVVKHCINVLLTSGIMGKLTGYSPTKISNWLSRVEERMVFEFKTLFDALDEEVPPS